MYVAAPLSASNVLYRVNAGGAAIASLDNGPDWLSDNAATSTFHNTGSTTATCSALTAANLVNVPASTPLGIWTQERNDPTGGNEMLWTFPVTAGTNTQVRLYFASRSSSTRRFNVLIDGVTKLSNYDPNVDPGVNKGTMKSFDITSDGTVNIDFIHVIGNPEINAIEIVNNTTGSNANVANVINYDGTSIVSQGLASTGTFDWTNVRNAVMVGRTLFYGQTDGRLYRRPFDGVSFGDGHLGQPLRRPALEHRPDGLRAGHPDLHRRAADLVHPAAHRRPGCSTPTAASTTRAPGRTPCTGAGSRPTAASSAASRTPSTGGNITWSTTRGMFLDGSNLYVVSSTNGNAAQDRLRQRRAERHVDGG